MELLCFFKLFDEAELKIIDKIISDGEWDYAGTGFKDSEPQARSTKIKWISKFATEKEQDILSKKLVQSFENANKHYKFQITELSDVGILKYDVGDYYTKHIDMGGTGDIRKGFPSRKLSLVAQLSNDYEGGDTLFHKSIDPIHMEKQYNSGTVFPSFLCHEVTPIEKGIRYSLVAWAIGDSFK